MGGMFTKDGVGIEGLISFGYQCDADTFTCPNGTVLHRLKDGCKFPECFGVNATEGIYSRKNFTTVSRQNVSNWFLEREFVVRTLDIYAVRRGQAFDTRMRQFLDSMAHRPEMPTEVNTTYVKVLVTAPPEDACVTQPDIDEEEHILPVSTHPLSRFAVLGTIRDCPTREALAITLGLLANATAVYEHISNVSMVPRNTSLFFQKLPVLAVETSSNLSSTIASQDHFVFPDGSNARVSDILSQLRSLRGNGSGDIMAGVDETLEQAHDPAQSKLDVTFVSFPAITKETTTSEDWNEHASTLGRWVGIPHDCAAEPEEDVSIAQQQPEPTQVDDSLEQSLQENDVASLPLALPQRNGTNRTSNCSCWTLRQALTHEVTVLQTFADLDRDTSEDREIQLCD